MVITLPSAVCCSTAPACNARLTLSRRFINGGPASRGGPLAFAPFDGLKAAASLPASSSSSSFSMPGCGQQEVFVCGNSDGGGMRHGSSRRQASLVVAAATATDEEVTVPPLNDLPLINYINQNGRIQPPVETTTKASVFAIFDMNKKAQYIGFSKDVRSSLRTLMGRRPELCFYFKLFNLDSLDQKTMLKCRQQWVSEMGLPPVGNGDPVQKILWEQPGDAGSISERGKQAAATSKAKELVKIMVEKGLKEEMVYDPDLLAKGKCEVLVSEDQTAEERKSADEVLAAEAARRRAIVVTSPAGDKVEFEIFFEQKFPTNGGWMYDILVSKDDKETRHRVICGRIYPEAVNIPEDRFVEIIMGFLLHKKVPRRTEGLLAGHEFPINYFAVSEVAQHYDDMKEWFAGFGELPETYWRFNRLHDYGAANQKPHDSGPRPQSHKYDHGHVEVGSLVSSKPL